MGLRTIGQLAKDSGVTVDTIRYYERIGLLPRRLPGRMGWRRYSEEMLAQLRYVREGRAVGSPAWMPSGLTKSAPNSY